MTEATNSRAPVNVCPYCGEEDLLGHYLVNYDAATKRHVIGPKGEDRGKVNGVMIGEGEWRDFVQAGVTQFGSGWAWLAVKDGKLSVMKTPNGENPLMHGASPILGVDVWEHSYYIDYRNVRQKYLEAFVDSLVNWEHVEALLGKA